MQASVQFQVTACGISHEQNNIGMGFFFLELGFCFSIIPSMLHTGAYFTSAVSS
jgi:hypothetical protein